MAIGNFRDAAPALILLSGLPGAGKTTFAHALARYLAFEHIESDAIRRELSPRPTYDPRESAKVFARAEAAARKSLRAGCHAVIDATNLTNGDRRRFVVLAKRLGVGLICVRVVAPEAVIRARLSAPRAGHSQATVGVYELMRGRARPFAHPAVVVDTEFDTAPSAELVARLVEDRLPIHPR